MIEVADKVRYVDASLEAAEQALNNQSVIEQLGPFADSLPRYMGRLVPVLSTDDAEAISDLSSPDTIPLLVIGPNDDIELRQGVHQFSTAQREAASTAIESWKAKSHSTDKILLSLLALSRMDPSKDYSHRIRAVVQSAQFTDDMFVNSDEFRDKLTLTRAPNSKVVRVSYRPLMCLYMSGQRPTAKPQVLLHELTHVGHSEANPIHHYSTQQEIDTSFLRNELEAYHVGAVVVAGLSEDGLLKVEGERDSNVLVERARLSSPQYDPSDPFKPNRMLRFILDDEGFGLDTIIQNRPDLDRILRSMGINNTATTIIAKGKKGGRYTPPKNKR
jgi:hypothetical protein